jgi:hypothetical protein
MRRHTIVIDWDGTLVPNEWPRQPTTWMHGAREAMDCFHAAGFGLTVFSARMNPYDPVSGKLLDKARPAIEKQYIRGMLDSHGYTFVDIWDKPGKPSASLYIDDKGIRYAGTKGAWKAVTTQVMLHLTGTPPQFPAMPLSDELEAP